MKTARSERGKKHTGPILPIGLRQSVLFDKALVDAGVEGLVVLLTPDRQTSLELPGIGWCNGDPSVCR